MWLDLLHFKFVSNMCIHSKMKLLKYGQTKEDRNPRGAGRQRPA